MCSHSMSSNAWKAIAWRNSYFFNVWKICMVEFQWLEPAFVKGCGGQEKMRPYAIGWKIYG